MEDNKKSVSEMPKGAVYGGLGGAIFGCLCWMIVMSAITGEWYVGALVALAGILLFIFGTKACFGNQQRYWRVVLIVTVILAAINFLVVNLRWNAWMEVYRQTSYYSPVDDRSLTEINLYIAALFAFLLILFVMIGPLRLKLDQKKSQ